MLPNPQPTVRFESRHHWKWMTRRILLGPKKSLFLASGCLIIIILVNASSDLSLFIFPIIFFGSLILSEGLRLFWIYMDWKSRSIRLYSDGRLEYEYGIWTRHGLSVSLRFGSVRYDYRDRMDSYLDCADVVLPFDSGIVEAIPRFHTFWEISQGRIQ